MTKAFPQDLYGVDFAFDENGDLKVSPGGRVATIAGPANVREAIIRRLGTARGEMFNHPEYGSGLPDLWGEGNVDVVWARAVREVREALSLEPRVGEVQDVHVRSVDGNRFDVLAFYKLIDDSNVYNVVFPFFVR